MFELLGDSPDAAGRNAATVMAIRDESRARFLDRVDRRDPYKLSTSRRDRARRPHAGLRLARLLKPRPRERGTFNVTEPEFFKAFAKELQERSLDDVKTYLRWHLARASSPALSSAFVNENFAFFSKTLRGVPELRPRWKRCVALVDSQLGEALGQEFVRRAFSPELKAKTLRMTRQVEAAMKKDIEELDWMDPATKKRAQEKLHTLVNKIGYPRPLARRYWPVLAVKRADFFGNVERATLFESRRDLAKIGKPLDRGEWSMTPPTVNAYYNAQMNDINFPASAAAAALRPEDGRRAQLRQHRGTIGHELTHGFDDEGRKFDAKGNLEIGGRRRMPRHSTSARSASWTSTRSTRSSTT
jgi:endothelin-converting enzyme/putative endopeptidase